MFLTCPDRERRLSGCSGSGQEPASKHRHRTGNTARQHRLRLKFEPQG